jgi:hypothetical protein
MIWRILILPFKVVKALYKYPHGKIIIRNFVVYVETYHVDAEIKRKDGSVEHIVDADMKLQRGG